MNIKELKERLTQLNNKAGSNENVWKPKDEHQVRFVQNPYCADLFQELHFHYEIAGMTPILCPKANFGKPCTICDFADLLKAWKGPDGNDKPENARKADFEIFKKIQSKPRIFAPVIERGVEGKPDGNKAKWWGMTSAQVGQVLDVCMDGDRLEELGLQKDDKEALRILYDVKKGYDIQVSFKKPNEKGNTKNFTVIEIKGRIKSSLLAKNDDLTQGILSSVKKLSEVFPEVKSEEVDKLLQKFVGNAKPETTDTAPGNEKYEKKADAKPNTKENAKVSGTRSIDEAFEDLVDGA